MHIQVIIRVKKPVSTSPIRQKFYPQIFLHKKGNSPNHYAFLFHISLLTNTRCRPFCTLILSYVLVKKGRFKWPRGPRRGSAATRLLGFRVRISPGGAWMSLVSYVVRSLRRADHSSRGVLPSVVCLSVILKPR